MLILFVVLLDMAAIVLVVIFLLQHIKTKFDFLNFRIIELYKILNDIVTSDELDPDENLKDHKHFYISSNVVSSIRSAALSMKGK